MLWILIIIVVLVAFFVLSNSSNSNLNTRNNNNQNTDPVVDESQLNDDLSSAVGLDYRRLRNLLATGNWQKANKETLAVMLKAIGEDNDRTSLVHYELNNFPCTDLRTIDKLWVKYSNGRFGFSVQKRIYERAGYEYVNFARREKFSEDMIEASADLEANKGFQKQVKTESDEGYFPNVCNRSTSWMTMGNLCARLNDCEL